MALITPETKQKVKMRNQPLDDELRRFKSLPESLRNFIVSKDRIIAMSQIVKIYNLSDEKAKIFKRVTTQVLAGIIPITKYKETLERELNIDIYSAHKIATEVRDKIFAQVTDELRKVHGLDK